MEDSSILRLSTTPPAPIPGGECDPQHPDGQCFVGPRGRLAVVLRPETLASMYLSEAPTHWLLPIDEPDLVRISEWLPGRILWLGAQPPSRLLGALVEQPLGAWLHSEYVEIQLDTGNPILRARNAIDASHGTNLELARLVVEEWLGSRPTLPNPRVTPMVRLPRIPDYAAA